MRKHDRQSFLGLGSETILRNVKIGIVGLGGGGSHVVQQAAHIGVGNYVLIDPDVVEDNNLNRLVGGTLQDVTNASPKIDIAVRIIRSLVPNAAISAHARPWQEIADELKDCDVIIGGLDSVTAKDDLDRFCRRFLIPYIDMGMDVHEVGGRYLIAGQVVLTTSGSPCLRCLGVVTEGTLQEEARNYGAAGGKPQVVWPNGLLASAAVGLFAQIVCPWHDKVSAGAYLEYDGNKHTLVPNQAFGLLATKACEHHVPHEAGDALFDVRKPPPNRQPAVRPDARPNAWWGTGGAKLVSMLRSVAAWLPKPLAKW
jgi:molybdopterin/thiamine biosynthesis adenylyltransferase